MGARRPRVPARGRRRSPTKKAPAKEDTDQGPRPEGDSQEVERVTTLVTVERRGRGHVILDRFRLDGQAAVVTGAGRGLGAAIAVAFAEVGADVLICSRTRSELDTVAAQIEGTGRRAHVVVADLAKPETTAELAGMAVEAFGRLDVVVNNVGGSMPNTLLTTSVGTCATPSPSMCLPHTH